MIETSKIKMPKMRPILIETKNQPIWVRIWRWITSIRKWEIVEDWCYKLPDGPTVVIPKGFVFDGASIPRPLWFLLSPTGLLFIPGLIHDFAYRYDYLWAVDRWGVVYKYKENAGQWYWDGVFRKVGTSVNGMALIDMIGWLTLLLGGWWSWCSNRRRNADEIKPSKNHCISAQE